MLQISDLSEKEAFFSFTDRLKPWAKQELQRRGVQELTNAMMVAESIVELAPRRDRFESSKPNRRGNGGYHEEDEEGQSMRATVVAAMVIIENHEIGSEDLIARKKRGESYYATFVRDRT
ncbi:hypothetical protein Goshw_002703 [Gossypium schwendimanii]|uniref:Uncharacterized protein n=1 Tax=Gossypium schwendimanii TaxID=34291 RepID=A0A7J9LJV9_GOSSC|nr:hypothetical protein [Gossypium schwendimanii]